jgi:tetratricopeptide (TPR) repeat protein
MDPTLYHSLTKRASDLFDAGEHQQAIEIFRQLVDSDLPALDRGMMCLNIATVEHRRGNVAEALAALEHAIGQERVAGGYFIAGQVAAFLSQLGRYDDSIAAYRELVGRTDVSQADADIFQANIATLEKLAAGQPADGTGQAG